MIQENDIQINDGNIRWWAIYLEEAKELNAFVKGNFGKEEIAGMSIAPIIKDLHKENAIIEKAIADYKKRNRDVFEQDAYYITMYDCEWGSPKKYDGKDETYFEVIHILKGGSKPANKQVERFRYRKYRSGHITIDADGPSFGNEPLDCSMNNYIDLFYTGRLEETSEIMWSRCKRIHNVISKL